MRLAWKRDSVRVLKKNINGKTQRKVGFKNVVLISVECLLRPFF
jgi:hypothetical protein